MQVNGTIDGGADLRRTRQDADVVIQDVVAYAKATPNRHVPAFTRRIGEAHARHKIFFWRLRRTECDQPRSIRNAVQFLLRPAKWSAGVFVAESKIEVEMTCHLPDIIHVPVNSVLVPGISRVAKAAFGEATVLQRILVPGKVA